MSHHYSAVEGSTELSLLQRTSSFL